MLSLDIKRRKLKSVIGTNLNQGWMGRALTDERKREKLGKKGKLIVKLPF